MYEYNMFKMVSLQISLLNVLTNGSKPNKCQSCVCTPDHAQLAIYGV